MATKWILSVLAIVFLTAATVTWVRDGKRIQPKSKTWFLIGGIFSAVSVWLWWGAA